MRVAPFGGRPDARARGGDGRVVPMRPLRVRRHPPPPPATHRVRRHPPSLPPSRSEMLDTPGPYLLDVVVPHIQHVLPMIPGGGSFKDIITTGDGTVEY